MKVTQTYINDLSYSIVGAAIEVHKHLGPGLLESVYHSCLLDELESRKIYCQSHVKLPVLYKGKNLGNHLILDILVEDLIIVGLKAVEEINKLYEAQLLSYVRLTGKPKGLLINFNTTQITKGLRPLVNDVFTALPKDEFTLSNNLV